MNQFLAARSYRELFSALIQLFPKNWNILSASLCLSYVLFAVCYMWMGADFAKLGISLPKPEFMGGVKETPFKLYMFELLLLPHLLLALPQCKKVVKVIHSKFLVTMVALMVFALVRLLVDFKLNPMLGIRNASFVWYMLLSVSIGLINIDRKKIEFSLIFVFAAAYIRMIYSMYLTLRYDPYPIADLISDVGGMYPFVAWYFLARSPRIWLTVGFFVAVALGFQVSGLMSRTSVLGILIVISFMVFFLRSREAVKRLCVFGLLVLVGMGIWQTKLLVLNAFTEQKVKVANFENPLIKTTEKKIVENYRFVMWKQALERFIENPLMGIGFQKQVVTEIYVYNDIMYPNDGTIAVSKYKETTALPAQEMAPVSGPHNSYLNAMARIGIYGAVLVLLHLWGTLILLQDKLYFCAFALAGQAFYAIFNVGLEGPIRSFILLLAMGVVAQKCIEDHGNEKVWKTIRYLLRLKGHSKT